MSDLKNKRIITVATTGAWPTKDNTPNVPIEPAEIAEEIYNCWKEGAAVAHIHCRNDKGEAAMHGIRMKNHFKQRNGFFGFPIKQFHNGEPSLTG